MRRLAPSFLFLAALVLVFPVVALAQAAAGAPAPDLFSQAKAYYLLYGPAVFTALYFLAQAVAHIAKPGSKAYAAADWFLTGPARALVPSSVTGQQQIPPAQPKGFASLRLLLALAIVGGLLVAGAARAQEAGTGTAGTESTGPAKPTQFVVGSYHGQPINLELGLGLSGLAYNFSTREIARDATFTGLAELSVGAFPLGLLAGGGFQAGENQGLALQVGPSYRPLNVGLMFTTVLVGSTPSFGLAAGYVLKL